MADATTSQQRTILLQSFANRKDPRLSYAQLKEKFGPGKGRLNLEAEAADRLVDDLIADGLLAVTGGGKDGAHPRPKASYRLTSKGKDHLRPARPGHHSPELLEFQEAYLLLQVFRAEGRSLSRSKINDKLKTKAAVQSLEFDPKSDPATIHYHLSALVENAALAENRTGTSTSFTLTESGLRALATARQHVAASFTLKGEALNELLAAARGSTPVSGDEKESELGTAPEPATQPGPATPTVGEDDILRLVDHLKAGDFAGRELIPIHEVRRLVAEHHGRDAASHPTFDRLVKRLRSDDRLVLTAISDSRGVTQQELDDSIPGMNEVIFYIVIE